MKHLFLVMCLLAGSVSLLADDFNYLVLTQTNESSVGFALRKTRSITFDGSVLKVVTADGETTVPLSTLNAITFTETVPVAVQTVRGTWPTQRIVVYNTSGVVVRQFDSVDARMENVNLKNLPAGVYIIKEGTQTRKLLKR